MKQPPLLKSSISVTGAAITMTGVNQPLANILAITDLGVSPSVFVYLPNAGIGTVSSYTQSANSVLTLGTSPSGNNLQIIWDNGLSPVNPVSTGALESGGILATISTAIANIYTKILGSIAVTGTFWQNTQPVSIASVPLATGAATAANQVTGGPQTGSGVVSSTTQRVTLASDGPEVTNSTAIKNSVAAIPAKGAATIVGSTPVNIASDQIVPISAVTLPLPTGAASSANQATTNAKIPSLGSAAMSGSFPVTLATDGPGVANLTTIASNTTKAGSLTMTSSSVGASSATLLAASSATKYLGVQNTHSTQTLTVSTTTPATATNGYVIPAGGLYEFPFVPSNALYVIGSGAATTYTLSYA